MRHNSVPEKSAAKPKYKTRNWSEYNKALEERGNITLWINEANDGTWYEFKDPKKKGVLIRILTSPLKFS